MNILAVIQARGGSKSVPGKNIRELGGKPLIAWTILAAKASKKVTRVVVNTDDPEIAAVAKQFGAEVPFLRPAEFATDKAPSLPMYEHALAWFAEHENYRPDAIGQLKPTNPLRTAGHIDAAIDLFLAAPPCDSVISVSPVHDHPYKIWKVGADGFMEPFLPESFTGIKDAPRMRRQDLPPAFRHNGAVNVIVPITILEQHSMNGRRVKAYVMAGADDSLNIDTIRDFAVAEFILRDRTDRV